MLLSAKRRAYFCKSIAIEMGGVSRYFSKVSGSGVGWTLLKISGKAARHQAKVCSSKRRPKSEPRSVRPNGVVEDLCRVHANGGIINGGVACVCAKCGAFLCILALFCAFFVCFCAFFPTKMACKKAQIGAEFCKNVQKALLCNTPFSENPLLRVTDFECTGSWSRQQRSRKECSSKRPH